MHLLKKSIFSSVFFKIFIVVIFSLHVSGLRANFNFLAPVANLSAYNTHFTAPWMFSGMYPDEIRISSFYEMKMEVYDSLRLDEQGLNREAFQFAIRGMEKLIQSGYPLNENVLSIADFSQPSTEKRLYVVDLSNYTLLFKTYVAHGRNTGKETAGEFSNNMSSFKSSLGFYLTGNTYKGKHGYSLKLQGLEKGINDNASRRAIVVHGADYVTESAIHQMGFLGRSQGCPAIPMALNKPIINEIKDGTCLFIYHPSAWYLNNSRLLN
ncbi:MAG TPA: murein L,D-transpeptidase catalytic domain family protein [Flavitalea sp.]|nr:murein L,D-transpeptidase catalytic domain family protein [Flavitalea sp.]